MSAPSEGVGSVAASTGISRRQRRRLALWGLTALLVIGGLAIGLSEWRAQGGDVLRRRFYRKLPYGESVFTDVPVECRGFQGCTLLVLDAGDAAYMAHVTEGKVRGVGPLVDAQRVLRKQGVDIGKCKAFIYSADANMAHQLRVGLAELGVRVPRTRVLLYSVQKGNSYKNVTYFPAKDLLRIETASDEEFRRVF